MTIITFCCQDSVFVYYKGCGLIPAHPYKLHSSIKNAMDELKKRGIKNPTVIEKK